MKRIQIVFFLFMTFNGLSQYSSFKFNYYGGAKAEVNGLSDIVDVRIPSGTALTSCNVIVYHPKTFYSSGQNVQLMNDIQIYATSTNFVASDYVDAYGNDYTELSLISNQTSDFIVQQTYNGETEVVLTTGFSSTTPYPTNIVSEYTQATTNIQSNDPDIVYTANAVTNGCTNMQDAVEKIAQWVIGSLTYGGSKNNNDDMDALSVFNRYTANCAGYTNLMIALLRSVGIPARFVSGVLIRHPFNMPYFNSIFPWGNNGPGLHAVYEVYYPDQGWVIADPQRTSHFCTTHFIRHNDGPDNCDALATCTYSWTGSSPPTFYLQDMCGTITDFDNNYDYDSYSMFTSAEQNKTLLN